jgi:hypothetical protein
MHTVLLGGPEKSYPTSISFDRRIIRIREDFRDPEALSRLLILGALFLRSCAECCLSNRVLSIPSEGRKSFQEGGCFAVLLKKVLFLPDCQYCGGFSCPLADHPKPQKIPLSGDLMTPGRKRRQGYLLVSIWHKMRKRQYGRLWQTQFVPLCREEVRRLDERKWLCSEAMEAPLHL